MDTHLPALVQTYLAYRAQNKPLVLATLVETDGPAYRKPGARMLIDTEGGCHGVLAIGLEKEISGQAQRLFSARGALDWTYDSRSGRDWDAGQDRNCMLRILFEYVDPDDASSAMALLQQALMYDTPSVLVTVIDSDIEALPLATRAWIAGETCQAPFPERYLDEIRGRSRETLQSGTPSLESFLTDSGVFSALFEVISPPLHLLIAGAGADAMALLELAKFTGWRVTLLDPGAGTSSAAACESADRYLHGPVDQAFNELDSVDINAAVLMTHSYEYDLGCLRQLAHTSVPYIGLLGPAAKRKRLLQSLCSDDVTLPERLYGPVGLDIGAELPEELAISIVAEIKAVRGRCAGGSLSRQLPAAPDSASCIDQLYVLLLAAGGSRRFGGLKQLVELQGKSLLRQSVERATTMVQDRVLVILGIKAKKLERELRGYKVSIIENLNWENGVASSIRAGVEALPQHCRGALILFCDQPFITAGQLRELIGVWGRDPSKIVCSRYSQTVGVPAIIPRQYFSALMKLTGDKGAKAVILKHREHMISVDLPEAAFDIDTQGDLIDAINSLAT